VVGDDRVPAPPSDLIPRGRGRRFWRAVLTDHDLRADELELLAETCRMLDLTDRLRAAADDAPVVVDGRTSPALVELRQVRQELRRQMAQLALPDEVDDRTLPASVANMRTVRARKAARMRWDREA
jgi:hypothetical protein